MTDYFALLQESRRPWIDPDLLRQKFLTLASDFHPDRVHEASDSERAGVTNRYAELNAAFQCLAEPKLRLRHLLELELGSKPQDIETIPSALANFFAEVATTCRNADIFLAEKKQVLSPILQVQLFERGQDWLEELSTLQGKLNTLKEKLTEDLKSTDRNWMTCDSESRQKLLSNLEEIYRLFGYFNRWTNQIHERILQLSF